MQFPNFKVERENLKKYDFVIGVDEVGMGPVCGPVVAAACLLDPKSILSKRTKKCWYARVRDSKMTKESERDVLLEKILENSLAQGIGEASAKEVDKLNIHQASLLCKKRAIEKLSHHTPPGVCGGEIKVLILIDGLYTIPDLDLPENFIVDQKAIVKGDMKILSISCASIIAKVYRDNIMKKWHKKFPEYGFDRHKGYGTKFHMQQISALGLTPIHRKTFLHPKK